MVELGKPGREGSGWWVADRERGRWVGNRERVGSGWQGEGRWQVSGWAAQTVRVGGAYRAGGTMWAVGGLDRVVGGRDRAVGGQSGASPTLDMGEHG